MIREVGFVGRIWSSVYSSFTFMAVPYSMVSQPCSRYLTGILTHPDPAFMLDTIWMDLCLRGFLSVCCNVATLFLFSSLPPFASFYSLDVFFPTSASKIMKLECNLSFSGATVDPPDLPNSAAEWVQAGTVQRCLCPYSCHFPSLECPSSTLRKVPIYPSLLGFNDMLKNSFFKGKSRYSQIWSPFLYLLKSVSCFYVWSFTIWQVLKLKNHDIYLGILSMPFGEIFLWIDIKLKMPGPNLHSTNETVSSVSTWI